MARKSKTKYVFVTGGVVSSLGNSIVAAGIGLLLKQRGLRVSILRLNPYLNLDLGAMSSLQHGEVFVTEDGTEADPDLGHYERFIDINTGKLNNVNAGQIYESVLNKERKGDYLGSKVRVIPHITDEIKDRINQVVKESKIDILIVEIGGVIGDLESLPFVEAVRQFKAEAGVDSSLCVHLTFVPYLTKVGELKTKPTQRSVKDLLQLGIQPDILIARTEQELSKETKEKIALFCNVDQNCVIEAKDQSTIYRMPLEFHKNKLDEIIIDKFNLTTKPINMENWEKVVKKIDSAAGKVNIAVVGKNVDSDDAYKSITESFVYAGAENRTKVNLKWVDSEDLEHNGTGEILTDVAGIIIPGGFGDKGVEGKLLAIKYARENKIPFLGICLGMQCVVIEFARNVGGMKNANSTEFARKLKYPVIDLMSEQKKVKKKGGCMRLGAFDCEVTKGTKLYKAYRKNTVSERHRHRYEVNNDLMASLEDCGLVVAGRNTQFNLVEAVELTDHPWFVAVQYHPELKSKLTKTHPLFRDFVKAALKYAK